MKRLLLAIFILAACGGTTIYPDVTPSTPTPTQSVTPSIAGTCHARGTGTQVEPDPVCTPGVVAVTDAAVLCAPGYSTKSIRPPVSYTNTLKVQQMAAYGFTGNPRAYEEDHLISLELGGSPTDPRNLWPEPGASPNHKDHLENTLHRLVCSGQLSLATAQQAIASDWVKAFEMYVGGAP